VHHHSSTVAHRSRRRLVALLLAVGAATPATAVAAPAHRERPEVPELSWHDCGDGLQCATASVPLDHDRPRGRHISLSLAKRTATDPAHRIGTLFVNNGGPGNSVLDFMRSDVVDVVPATARARFDVVGFDPRGVGESTPVRCFASVAAQEAFFGELAPFPVSAEEIAQATTAARRLGRECRRRNGDLLDHVSTADVARDLDLLRQSVGDDQLTFAGYSYGGLIAMTYAQLHPGRVRATLLDGAPDPVAWTRGTYAQRNEPFSVRVGSHVASGDALGSFLDQCQAAGPDACAFASPDTRGSWDALMARLLQGPVVVDLPPGPAGPGGPVPISYAFAVDSMRGALQFPPIWADVAGLFEAIEQAAAAPSAAPTASVAPATTVADEPAAAADDEPYDNSREALVAVACAETRNPRDARRWTGAATAADREAPYFGADLAWLSLPCATWPGRAADAVAGRFDAVTAHPMLFVNSRFDAASPYARAAAVAARTPGARLLTVEGAGHPASFIPNECVAAAVGAYLVDLTLPAAGAVCAAEITPFS
jgi:pimeloyl-ACP methyl ester carboxylesterase